MTETRTFDAVAFKDGQRDEWKAAASGWAKWSEQLEGPESCGAASRKLVELAGIGPGDAVLDVAAGYGEPAITVARTVAPDGRVVCNDISAEMLHFARERAEAAGLDNLEFVESDAEGLSYPDETFDAVISRWGLMFLPDVTGTLKRFHAFLKPHGRLAAAVWGPPQEVQWSVVMPVVLDALELPPPPPGPGVFALADAEKLARLVEEAGFRDVETGSVPIVIKGESPERFTDFILDVSAPVAAIVHAQRPEVQQELRRKITDAWAPFTTPEGRVRTENRTVWVAGTK